MKKKKVDVTDLQFGMYVTELDRPWTETPFLYQGFVIQADDAIATLRRFCKFVWVDDDRSEVAAGGGALAARPGLPLAGIRKVEHVPTVAVEHEIAAARDVFGGSQVVVEEALKSAGMGGELDAKEVKGAVAKMTASILRNPDALVLFATLKEKGGYFLTRSMNTSLYMIMFARFLGMEQVDIEKAGLVGLLQDIAMVRLPEAVVNKKGPLSPEELKLIRSHVMTGAEILSRTPGLSDDIAVLAALHHERYDGSGYPKSINGGDLGTIGAFSGLADTYCAMITARPYADPMTPSNALGMLHKWRGKAFHPDLVEEFIRCIGMFPVGSVVELNSGEVGIVIAQNIAKRLQPRVMVVRDATGQPLRPQKLLDLSRSPKATVDEVYRIRRTLEFGRSGIGLKDVVMN